MKKIDKIKKVLLCFIISILLFYIGVGSKVYASLENMQFLTSEKIAAASWSDNGEGFDDSWGYESYDYSYDYYDDGSSGFLGVLFLVFFIIVIVVIVIVINKKSKNTNSSESFDSGMSNGYSNSEPNISEAQVENQIRAIDPDFSREEFLSWAKDVFVKLQYAWSDRNLDILRCFETPQLFEHHRGQIKRYINNRQINKLEKVSINWAKLFEFKQDGSREVLSVLMNTKMIDYIFDERKNEIIKGSNNKFEVNTYKLTFIRSAGVKTVPGTISVNTTNCPNCGAPVQITASGKCSYCGTVITTGNFNWVLSNMETYKEPINDWMPYNDGNIGGFGTGFISGAITGSLISGLFRPRLYFGGPVFGPRPPRRGPRGPMGGFGGPRGPRPPRR